MIKSDSLDPSGAYPWLSGHWSFFMQRFVSGRLAHAVLIGGPAGNGKLALAGAMAAKLLCRENQLLACGRCRSCTLLAAGSHPDYFELQPEEGSKVIKVDHVRGLIGRLDLTTSISERKVAYIHPAESMNANSANALLKSLEEPTGNTVLILVSNNPGRLPITIRSRCQLISVGQPDPQLALDWLTRISDRPKDELIAALQAAGGSPLRAAYYLGSPDLDGYGKVKEGLVTLLARPGAVSAVSGKLDELNPDDLWRWLSLCTGEAIKSIMAGLPLSWLPANMNLNDKMLLQLQQQADINRQLSTTQIRGDLLLQDWLIKWVAQVI